MTLSLVATMKNTAAPTTQAASRNAPTDSPMMRPLRDFFGGGAEYGYPAGGWPY